MLFLTKKYDLSSNFSYKLFKKGVTSGGSRLSFSFRRFLPMNFFIKKLKTTVCNKAGRNSKGKIVIFTKTSLKFKKSAISINYSFRLRSIGFIGSINILPFSHKIISLMFLSNGSITYIPSSNHHSLFSLIRLYTFNSDINLLKNKFNLLGSLFYIKQGIFLIRQLPKNQPVSLLESLPGEGIKYVRSPSVFGKIYKMDFRTNIALVRLPSGVRKVFSTFSLGSIGKNPLLDNKYWFSNKAGYYRSFGKKSIVRGVAMNPVDHPHGGRTKSINYPRTPWGKTTKFK